MRRAVRALGGGHARVRQPGRAAPAAGRRARRRRECDVIVLLPNGPKTGVGRSTLMGGVGTLQVRVGDEKVLSMHPDRTLFLCYPGVDGMAEACLRRYRGPLLLYVGEGRYAFFCCSPSSVARRSQPCPLPWVLLRALALAARSIQLHGLSCESIGGGDLTGAVRMPPTDFSRRWSWSGTWCKS